MLLLDLVQFFSNVKMVFQSLFMFHDRSFIFRLIR